MTSMSASRVARPAPHSDLGSFNDGHTDFAVTMPGEETLHVYCGGVLALVLRGVRTSVVPYAVSWSDPWRTYDVTWRRRFVFETLMVFLRHEANHTARKLVPIQ
ncbi:hypothetical protein AB0B28_16390 [Glycomyces sp. NPDC046736]|uniref:hypothetical protein n=1 Tax=Glycomyces sp. NPDC046736 TaxID=3155615 RepID=UPI0033F7B54A